jgi:hypothetical protein
MQITIKCPCGSPYTVEETPVNGHLCFPVACPKCKRDGTELANEYIRKSESGELAREQARGGGGSGFSVSRLFGRGSGGGADTTEHDGPAPVRLGLGVLGACVGGAVGMMVWYFIVRWTGYEIGYVAWGVGVFAGLGARLAVPSGSFGLAGVSALVAAVAIMGGQYLGLCDQVNKKIEIATSVWYEGMTDYAHEVVKATNEVEIDQLLRKSGFRAHDLAPGENAVMCKKRLLPFVGIIFKDVMKDGSAPTLTERISEVRAETKPNAADIAAFRQHDLPDWMAFLQGKPSQEEFSKTFAGFVRENLSFNNMLVESWSPYMLLWLLLGVGSAWRLAYNKSETE